MRNTLIVVSGGFDSITLLYQRQEEIALALSFDYGSKHNAQELSLAKLHTEHLCIPHIIIPLKFIGEYFSSALLLNGGDIPLEAYNERNMAQTVVPFRNGIMLSVAAGLAESKGLEKILIANHFGDHAVYPDCRKAFIDAMGQAVKEGTQEGILLEAPYTQMNKSDIAMIGKSLGIDYSKTWSCYLGREKQCGRCATCLERKEAMKIAGIEDHTEYEVL